jgi:uncharacterized membrane protein
MVFMVVAAAAANSIFGLIINLLLLQTASRQTPPDLLGSFLQACQKEVVLLHRLFCFCVRYKLCYYSCKKIDVHSMQIGSIYDLIVGVYMVVIK